LQETEISQTETSERKERWRTNRLTGTSSLEEGAMWHTARQRLTNTFQHATMGGVFSVDKCYSSLLGSTTILATVEEGCFLCGMRHATVELCFLHCPCRIYITWVHL
jgi:hypothetical protein